MTWILNRQKKNIYTKGSRFWSKLYILYQSVYQSHILSLTFNCIGKYIGLQNYNSIFTLKKPKIILFSNIKGVHKIPPARENYFLRLYVLSYAKYLDHSPQLLLNLLFVY